jgi:teichuronic acid biosynthesis glycosyltransferase TuaG
MPLISIIMPAFNASQWIIESIESIEAQSWKNWELIVMDDGSTDHTAALVKEKATKDKRIRYFFQNNMGQGKARAAAIQQSRGEWIALLDADDYWLPERLQEGMKALHTSGADFFFSSAKILYEGQTQAMGLLQVKSMEQCGISGLNWLLAQNSIPALTTLFSRQAYDRAGGFGSRRLSEDYALWLNMMATGTKFVSSPVVLAVYRFHHQSSSSSDRLLGKDCLEILGEILNTYPKHKNLIRQHMVQWIEERLCKGCMAKTKYTWYQHAGLMNNVSSILFTVSFFMPGRWRAKLLPKLAML